MDHNQQFQNIPVISIVIVVHNMQREAPRTLFTLTSDYQNIPQEWYEVVVVDNGSEPPLGEATVSSFGSNFRYHYLEPGNASPVFSLNFGALKCRGDMIGLMIDGARMLTPGILQYVIRSVRAYPDPVVSTLGFHLGAQPQQVSSGEGYDQDCEDRLLAGIDWRKNGYRLFQVGCLAGSSIHGWFSPIAESNCIFVTRDAFARIGGFDEAFDLPGGGLANLDFYRRACEDPATQLVILLGEGTFHQYHGGSSTRSTAPENGTSWQQMAAQYRQIRGRDYQTPRVRCDFLGHALPEHYSHLQTSLERSENLGKSTSKIEGPYDYRPEPGNPISISEGPRQCLVVLGMHRSGTSALTRAFNLLGAATPDNLLPATSDNETGYWESRNFLDLNKELLIAADTSWNDDAPIERAWYESETAARLRSRARQLLRDTFQERPTLVLKDPRFCRLLPFWRPLLQEICSRLAFVLIVRHPEEVCRSLAARSKTSEFKGAAITQPQRARLLWLRHLLESEYETRSLRRSCVTYDELLTDSIHQLSRLLEETGVELPLRAEERAEEIQDFLSIEHRHHSHQPGSEPMCEEVYRLFQDWAGGSELGIERLDSIRNSLNSARRLFAPLIGTDRPAFSRRSIWYTEILAHLRDRAVPELGRPLPRILFVTADPSTRSHSYAVTNHVQALLDGGFTAAWSEVEASLSSLQKHKWDIVWIFRTPWKRQIQDLVEKCRTEGILVGFGIDDLLFDPEVLTEHFDYLRRLGEQQRTSWLHDQSPGLARTLIESDFAVVSTEPLAEAVRALGKIAFVVPNGPSRAMIAQADLAFSDYQCGLRREGRVVRIGYASGTPTHQKDFGVVAATLAGLLRERPHLILTVVGYLDLAEFPELAGFQSRIEARPAVAHADLFREYARFDINLAPLEIDNPFCRCKSSLKYHEAALVRVPTVASATPPYRDAIHDGETGFCCSNEEAWRHSLLKLIDNPQERKRQGLNAYHHSIAAFGPERQSDRLRRILHDLQQALGFSAIQEERE